MSAPTSELLDDLRPRAFAIAYRMLGSVSEAEDVVQEALLRVHDALERGEEISSPRAYVATIVDPPRDRRAALGAGAARDLRRRVAAGAGRRAPGDDPAQHAELADSLSLAFLVVLESLTPEQRAAFLLHDVFDYDYGRVAEIIGTSQDNARQLASRARRHVQDGHAAIRFLGRAARAARCELFRGGRARRLRRRWRPCSPRTSSCTATAAGSPRRSGTRSSAAPRSLRCSATGGGSAFRRSAGWSCAGRLVNGQPGAEYLDSDGKLIGVMSLDIADGKVQAIRSIVNPEKLGHLGPVADAKELFARIRESRSG